MAQTSLIGPHEGREFELLDDHKKHVAFFHDIVPTRCYEYALRDEYDLIQWEVVTPHKSRPITIPYVILFRTSHYTQARRLENLIRHFDRKNWKESEREIGHILGYSNEAIEYFISTNEPRMT